MKMIIKKCLAFALAMTILVSALAVTVFAASDAQNAIRIKVDSDTFRDYQKVYCMIYDETADSDISSWISNNAEMLRDGDTDTWIYDLDAHGIKLDSTHTYSVKFATDGGKGLTDSLVISGYDSAKDYTAVFTELFTSEAFTEVPKFQYKWIGDNEINAGLDIIRIKADKTTFWEPIDRLYCQILDETANKFVVEHGSMTKEADADTWYFDLGKHGATLDPKHTYAVSFTDGRAETVKLSISDYDSSVDYTAVFTGEFVYDDVASMNRSAYKWSNDATSTKTDKNTKAANPMTVSVKQTITANSKKKTTIKKAVKVKKAQGKVTYSTNNKKVTVKKGALTVAKGLKKGKTYKVKITVTAKGNGNYKSKKIVKTIKIKVK